MIRPTLIGSVFLLAAAGCSNAATPAPTVAAGNACDTQIAAEGSQLHAKVYDAKPIYRDEFRARAITVKQVAGAKLFVPAEKGMTEAYLHRAASCYAAEADQDAHPNDPLRPTGGVASIEVEQHRGSYSIAVMSDDVKTAEEIWERAKALKSGGSVQVKQVAAAGQTSHF